MLLSYGRNHHRARLYMDWSTMEGFPWSQRRFKPSGNELATTSCHIVGVTYEAFGAV